MPKLGMQPIRRQQLIEATITSISQYGFADTTVSRISKAAGVSSGIIHHYFGGKNELLEATMHELLRQLRSEVGKRLAMASDPRSRIAAIIDGNFAPELFSPQATTTWLAFWAQVPHVPGLARLQRINAGRVQSNLHHAFKQLLPETQAKCAAVGLAALMDGLWLRFVLSDSIDAITARRTAHDYVARLLSEKTGQNASGIVNAPPRSDSNRPRRQRSS